MTEFLGFVGFAEVLLSMSSIWDIRRYKEGDEYAISQLLKTVFGRWHTLEYWKWLYKENPAGPPIIWVAKHPDKIVGHRGIIPLKIKIDGISIKGSQAIDSAVHPEYRRKGIWKTLASKGFAEAKEEGFLVTYSFASVGSIVYKEYVKYEHGARVCSMLSMKKILKWERVLKKYARNKILLKIGESVLKIFFRSKSPLIPVGLNVDEIKFFDDRIDKFWIEVSKDNNIMLVRDKVYLNWRYTKNPETKYTIYEAEKNGKILGFVVLKDEVKEDIKRGKIVDILGFLNKDDVITHLILKAIGHFKEKGVDVVECELSENHPYLKIFKKAGFLAFDSRIALLIRINTSIPNVSESFLKKKQNWFVTYGDSDLV